MESKPPRPTAYEASAVLREAEAARAALAGQVATPSWFFASLGLAIAMQIATAAGGLHDAQERTHLRLGVGAPWLIVAGLAVFAAVAGVQLWRFPRLNSVWVGRCVRAQRPPLDAPLPRRSGGPCPR